MITSKIVQWKYNKLESEVRALRAKNIRLEALVEADSQILKALIEENIELHKLLENRK